VTISTSRTQEFTVHQIVRAAYRCAGLVTVGQEPSAARAAVGRELLQFILADLESDSLCARNVVFEDVTCVDGQQQYTLDDDVLEVVAQAAYVPVGEDPDEPESQTSIQPMHREGWLSLTNKAQQGRPTLYWADRTASPITLHLHPIPDEAGTVRLQVQRLRASMLDGNATPDFERYFAEYLRWRLAHDLAIENSLPLDRANYLNGRAASLRQRMLSTASQGLSDLIYMDHHR
jgi:hypothetical protein